MDLFKNIYLTNNSVGKETFGAKRFERVNKRVKL